MPSKLESALHLAALGFRIFPLIPNSKKPAIARWRQRSTSDARQIAAWWTAAPERNIGIDTAGCIAIDVDNKGVKRGSESLQLLEMLWGDLPSTYRQRTPTGGLHIVYKGDARNSASRIAAGIDVRGTGGYLVGAGSTIDGAPYEAVDPSPIVPAPKWIADQCEPPARDAAERAPATELDEPGAINRALEYLEQNAPLAIQGAAGDATAFAVAARVKDLGVSEPVALDLLLDHWNERCSPPWGPEELAVKVENAYRYGREAPGAASPIADFEGVPLPPAAPQRAAVLDWNDDTDVPEPDPVIDGVFDQRSAVVIYGRANVGKSFVVQKMAHCVAAGLPFAGRDVERGAVLYVATEGHGGLRRRLKAMRKALGGQGLPFRFMLVSGSLVRDKALREAVRAEADALVAESGWPLRMLVVDTLSASAPGMDENAAGDVSAALKALTSIAAGTDAATVIIHHEGKNGANGPRGSSAFTGNVDVQIRVADGLITSDKERENGAISPIRFDLQVVEVGVTRRGKTVTSCVARVYGPAERDFGETAMTPEESQMYALLRQLCEDAAGPDGELGWVNVSAWRDAYRKFVIMHGGPNDVVVDGTCRTSLSEAERKRWQRCGTGLRDKGWVVENNKNQVVTRDGTNGTFTGQSKGH